METLTTKTLDVTATTVASDAINLTGQQQDAYDRFVGWFGTDASYGEFSRIAGYAGVGKTTCLIEMIKHVLNVLEPRHGLRLPPDADPESVAIAHLDSWDEPSETTPRVLLCAPTHAALNVMKRKIDEAGIGDRVVLATIQSACAFKMVMDDNGVEHAVRNKDKCPEIGSYSFVAIDEIQMLNSQITDFLQGFNFGVSRVLLLGDPAQPEPVGELSSSAFDMPVAWEAVLTDVVRYSGAALKIATWIRDELRSRTTTAQGIRRRANGGDHTLAFLGGTDATDAIATAFREGTSNPYAARIIASTNAAVDAANNRVRSLLNRTLPFEVGETLIANKPIRQWNPATNQADIVVNNGALLTIEGRMPWMARTLFNRALFPDTDLDTINRWQSPLKQCLELTCRDADGEVHHIQVLFGDDLEWHGETSREIATVIGKLPKGDRKPAWCLWHQFNDMTSPVKYGYATTTHKATGLTFDTTFVLIDDFQCWMLPSRNRLIYTALTRASKRTILVSPHYPSSQELAETA